MIRTTLLAAALALAGAATPAFAVQADADAPPTVILVHGAFADGSSWNKVITTLHAWKLPAVAVQNPLTSLADDVAATRRAIDAAPGKVVLVGHSWGGTVITEAGNDPKVQALVYVAAFAPDVGQSSAQQGEGFPVGPGLTRLQEKGGYLTLPADAIAQDFAPDVMKKAAALLYSTQVPLKASALGEAVTVAAWRSKPSCRWPSRGAERWPRFVPVPCRCCCPCSAPLRCCLRGQAPKPVHRLSRTHPLRDSAVVGHGTTARR